MSSADSANTQPDLFSDLLPEDAFSTSKKRRRHKRQSAASAPKASVPETPASAPFFTPNPFWTKVEALWAQRGIHLRPKVIMRTDPKTGKTVFTNTDLVPELAPRQEGAQWAASPSSGESVTQPPGKSTAKVPNCDASSAFCGTPETPTTLVFSGHTADSSAVRPHEVVAQPMPSDRDAMELQNGDPPEVRLKKLALKIFQNGGSYKTAAGNLGISRDKARTWKRLWQIGRFEDNIRGIRSSGDYPAEIKAKVRERLQAGATPGELEKEFKIPRQTIRKWCQNMCNANALQGEFDDHRDD